ncbi:MAG: AEC family transporter, partial [Clostridia bacterium]|nr:AEC family transporter [Clostridia bacterium]
MPDVQLFWDNMQIAAKQVGILYIMVLVGFIADKIGLYTEKTAKKCTDLLFYIVTPAVIINSFFKQEFTASSGRNLLISIGCGFLMHFVIIAICYPIYRKGDKDKNALFKFASIYGNVGYMVLPLTNAVLGSEGVFYCSGVVMAFNVIAFTHGVYIMDSSSAKFDLKKLVLNPGVLGVAVGLPFFLLNIKLPEIISAPVAGIDAMQTPLAMIIFGTYLANTDIASVFKNK